MAISPPIETPFADPITGTVSEVWRIYLATVGRTLGALAPITAAYWVSRSEGVLLGEQNLGALASGYLTIATAFGTATPASVAAIPQADVTGLVAALATLTSVIATVAALPVFAFGTYTPTLTNGANVAASTARSCQYLRVGSVVTVSGSLDVDPTTTATDTQLGIALPIASTFANATECAGTAWAPTVTSDGAAIVADVTNHRALMQWKAVDVSNATRSFSFTYRVI